MSTHNVLSYAKRIDEICLGEWWQSSFGGFLGQFLVPTFSDWIGHRAASILSFLGSAIFIYLFANAPATVMSLFGLLFILSFFSLGLIALLSGPIAAESVPAGLVASSIGLVVGAGEIFGGGITPCSFWNNC